MVKYIQLFGERCSGTNFVASLIHNNMDDNIMTNEFGWKHWFIKDHYPRGRPNQSTDYECIRPLSDNADTLFLCLFRNPFDWVRSINARPYHAGNHWGLTLTDFLRKPWHSFETARLNPCWSERQDQYWFIEEAENILRLRTQKIVHLLNLDGLVENVCFINYEMIRDDNDLLKKIADEFQIRLKHSNIIGEKKYFGDTNNTEFTSRKYPHISEEDLEFIRRELDWEVEGRIGYQSQDYNA